MRTRAQRESGEEEGGGFLFMIDFPEVTSDKKKRGFWLFRYFNLFLQPATWEDDGDSDDDDTPSVLSFFKKPDAPKKRHRFFFERCLEGVGDF